MSRTATILCPGPSLTTYNPPTRPDLVIAVNRAASVALCDWWSMLDAHTFGRTQCIGHPKILCGPQVRGEIKSSNPTRAPLHQFRDKRELAVTFPEAKPYLSFSFSAAIWLAVEQGATEIQCFGADFGGEADWDGHTSDRNCRTPERWTRERGLYEKLRELLAGRGVAVERVGVATEAVK